MRTVLFFCSFDGYNNSENFFSSADRIYIAHDILARTRYGTGVKVGIQSMLRQGIYSAAYPLHEVFCLSFAVISVEIIKLDETTI